MDKEMKNMPRVPKNAMAPKEEQKEYEDEDGEEMDASCDLETLLAAETIKNDPARMAGVKEAYEEKTKAMKSLRSIKDLKTAYKAKYEKKNA